MWLVPRVILALVVVDTVSAVGSCRAEDEPTQVGNQPCRRARSRSPSPCARTSHPPGDPNGPSPGPDGRCALGSGPATGSLSLALHNVSSFHLAEWRTIGHRLGGGRTSVLTVADTRIIRGKPPLDEGRLACVVRSRPWTVGARVFRAPIWMPISSGVSRERRRSPESLSIRRPRLSRPPWPARYSSRRPRP